MDLLAHVGHWATGVAAALPLVLCLAAVAVVIARDRLGSTPAGVGALRGDQQGGTAAPSSAMQHQPVSHRVT